MHKTPEWLLIAIAIIWSLTPWMLVAMAWAKWARTRIQGNTIDDLIDDPAFFLGQILATLSCLTLVPFYMSTTTRWEQLRIYALEYGVIISGAAGLIALFILPFANRRAKWLSFTGCLFTESIVVMFFLSLG